MSDDFTKNEEAALPRFVRTFQGKAYTYRYDFDALSIEQVLLAESAFNFELMQQEEPPKTFREYEISGRMDYLAKAMAYLLMKVAPDGTIVSEWNRKTSVEEALSFIRALSASEYAKLKECKRDFFGRVNIADDEQLRLVRAGLKNLGITEDMLLKMMMAQEEQKAAHNVSNSSGGDDFSSPESTSGSSENS